MLSLLPYPVVYFRLHDLIGVAVCGLWVFRPRPDNLCLCKCLLGSPKIIAAVVRLHFVMLNPFYLANPSSIVDSVGPYRIVMKHLVFLRGCFPPSFVYSILESGAS